MGQHAAEYVKHPVHRVHPQRRLSPFKLRNKSCTDSCELGELSLRQPCCLPPLAHKTPDGLRAFVNNVCHATLSTQNTHGHPSGQRGVLATSTTETPDRAYSIVSAVPSKVQDVIPDRELLSDIPRNSCNRLGSPKAKRSSRSATFSRSGILYASKSVADITYSVGCAFVEAGKSPGICRYLQW